MYDVVTLKGTYLLPNGSPAKGTIEIIPSEKVIVDDGGDVLLSGRVKIDLDETGSFSVDLPATDDPRLNPTGFGYTVAAKLNHHHPPAISFPLPAAVPVVDITDVTQVDPSTFAPGVNYVTPAELDAAVAGVVVDTSGLEAEVATKADAGEVDAALATKADAADVDALEGEVAGRLSEASLSTTFARTGAVNADVQAGATVANKINAAATAAPPVSGVVFVPATLSDADGTYQPSDLGIPADRTVVDYRNEKGTISNANQRGSIQMSRVFAANVAPVATASDNGSVLALDAILTGGTGGNGASGSTAHGENCALYAGTMRAAESTRSAWGANVLLTTYAPPTATMQSIGLEVNVGNNSGVDATDGTTLDGLAIVATGNADLRYGLALSMADPSIRYLDGIRVHGNASRAAVHIDAPVGGVAANDTMLGLLCEAPAQVATKVTVTGSTAAAPEIRAGGTDDHIDLILGGKNDGVLDFRGPTGAVPAGPDVWVNAKVNGTPVRFLVKIV